MSRFAPEPVSPGGWAPPPGVERRAAGRARGRAVLAGAGASLLALVVAVTVLAFVVGRPTAREASTSTSAPVVSPELAPTGSWSGTWKDDERDDTYSFTLDLRVEQNGLATGIFTWTILKTTYSGDRPGMRAAEAVDGTWDPVTGTLALEGEVIDDPDNFLVASSYRIVVPPGALTLKGATTTEVSGGVYTGTMRGDRSG